MFNIILGIIAVAPTLIAIYIVYRIAKAPTERDLMNQQAEQLESIKELLLRQEIRKAIDKRREELANQNKQDELANQNKQDEI